MPLPRSGMRRGWQLVLLSLATILAGIVGLYVWYVRGVGSAPRITAVAGHRWEIRAPLPEARTEVAAAAYSGRVYVIGGFDGFARTSATVQVYDPAADAWLRAPDLPQPVHHAMASALGNRLYVVGGFSGVRFVPTDRVFTFDGTAWRLTSSLPEPIGAGAIAVLDEGLHVVGGRGPAGDVSSHYRYDPVRNAWQPLAPIGEARDHLAVAVLGDRLYAIAGRLNGSLAMNVATVEVYDRLANRWETAPMVGKARSGHTAIAAAGRIYIFGGEEPGGTIDAVEIFDGRIWRTLTRLPTPRHGLGSAALGHVIYVLSGGRRPALSVSRKNEALVIVK